VADVTGDADEPAERAGVEADGTARVGNAVEGADVDGDADGGDDEGDDGTAAGDAVTDGAAPGVEAGDGIVPATLHDQTTAAMHSAASPDAACGAERSRTPISP
jgi:hypothetical protein